MSVKTVTVVIPTYNEEKNIKNIYNRVRDVFETELVEYQMQILFIDNASTDDSRHIIEGLCKIDDRVQAILAFLDHHIMGFLKQKGIVLLCYMQICRILRR